MIHLTNVFILEFNVPSTEQTLPGRVSSISAEQLLRLQLIISNVTELELYKPRVTTPSKRFRESIKETQASIVVLQSSKYRELGTTLVISVNRREESRVETFA
jgi:hypothetical protein